LISRFQTIGRYHMNKRKMGDVGIEIMEMIGDLIDWD
jgi:hypothetical protein